MKLILMGLIFCSVTQASVQIISDAKHSEVHFEAIGKPSMLKIKGEGATVMANFTIDQDKVTGTAKINLALLSTGIDMRDEHMKEKYLQVKQFPEALLKINNLTLPKNFSLKSPVVNDVKFVEQLDLHGVQKEVEGLFKITNEKLSTEADFEIKLSDFNIDIPTYMGVKVADVVKIHINLNQMDVQGDVKK